MLVLTVIGTVVFYLGYLVGDKLRWCCSLQSAKAAALKWWRKYREGIVARMNRELREHRRRPQPYGVQEDDMAPGAAYGDI
jgi:hypothetical protein